MKINILGTGSKGNAVTVDDTILIDCGLPYKHLKEKLPNIKKILITHRHQDHLNLSVLRRIHKDRPWVLKTLLHCNEDVASKIEHNNLNNFDFKVPKSQIIQPHEYTFSFSTNEHSYTVETFLLEHDVMNQGFIITRDDKQTLIYATDTITLKHAPQDRKFDYILIEGNFDEDNVIRALNSPDVNVKFRALQNFRHLSLQQFNDYVNLVKKPTSKIYQLHESEMFGLNSEIEKE